MRDTVFGYNIQRDTSFGYVIESHCLLMLPRETLPLGILSRVTLSEICFPNYLVTLLRETLALVTLSRDTYV